MRRIFLPGLVLAASLVLVWFLPPLPQDPAYHDFADQRAWLGIPHAANVLSNLPFLLVGLAGLCWLADGGARSGTDSVAGRRAWGVFFTGVALLGCGSAWYHLAPGNSSLVWDRLPMTLAFMGLLAAVSGERIGTRYAGTLLPVLVWVGLGSVLYWHWTELQGSGDLRPYVWVQFAPLLLIPLLLLYPARHTRGGDYLLALGLYLAAKLAELADRPIHEASFGLVSGHTLKHLLGAAAAACLLHMLMRRQAVPDMDPVRGC